MRKIIPFMALVIMLAACGSNLTEQEQRALDKEYRALGKKQAALVKQKQQVKVKRDKLFKQATALESKKKTVAKSLTVVSNKVGIKKLVFGPLPFKYRKGACHVSVLGKFHFGVLKGGFATSTKLYKK